MSDRPFCFAPSMQDLSTSEVDVLITELLASRPPRQPDFETENRVLRILAQHLLSDPLPVLNVLVCTVRDFYHVGSVGVSSRETTPEGEEVFRWIAIAGALEGREQTVVPTNFSPCGTVLNSRQPQLYRHPDRYFSYLQATCETLVEQLVVPVIVGDTILGTLWMISHNPQRHFDAEDVRLLMGLTNFAAGALHRVQASTKDATAQEQVEWDARHDEGEQQAIGTYRTLFQSIHEGYCLAEVIFDRNGQPADVFYIEANPAAARIFGRDFTGKRLSELGPNYESYWYEIPGRVAQTGKSERVERYAEPDKRWYDLSMFKVGDAASRHVAILFTDVTDRRQTEAHLRQAHRTLTQQAHDLEQANEALQNTLEELQVTEEELRQHNEELASARLLTELERQRYQDLFNFAPDGYVVTDATGVIQEANQAIAILLAIDPSFLVNTPLAHYIWESDRRAFLNLLYELHQQGKEQGRGEKLQTDALSLLPGRHSCSTNPTPVAITGTAIRNAQSKMIGVRWLIQDITERKQVEAERQQRLMSEQRHAAQMEAAALENARLYAAEQGARAAAEAAWEEAQSANRIKDEFLAILSHELRSPLNPILGWARLLQMGTLSAAQMAEAFAVIERNARLQTQLVNDLLDIAKILRGKFHLSTGPVDLAFVIESAIATVQPRAETKSITLYTDLSRIDPISGDGMRLQQVIWNLLSNAIKFTPTGGLVTISLKQVQDEAEIIVQDTGKGIHPDFLPHMFESFRQEDSSTTRQYGGLGLGLAIVREVVEAHGGSVTAWSPGEAKGATFTVRLPLRGLEPKLQQPETVLDHSMELDGIRVLIVDDEPDTCRFLAVLLSQYGATTITAASVEDALSNLQSFEPDLVVSDIGMPEMDGYTLIQHIRSLPPERGGQVPAIALTAYASGSDRQRVIENGFQEHLAKPIEPEQFILWVKAFTGR